MPLVFRSCITTPLLIISYFHDFWNCHSGFLWIGQLCLCEQMSTVNFCSLISFNSQLVMLISSWYWCTLILLWRVQRMYNCERRFTVHVRPALLPCFCRGIYYFRFLFSRIIFPDVRLGPVLVFRRRISEICWWEMLLQAGCHFCYPANRSKHWIIRDVKF